MSKPESQSTEMSRVRTELLPAFAALDPGGDVAAGFIASDLDAMIQSYRALLRYQT